MYVEVINKIGEFIMSDERIYEVKEEKATCFCQSKCFRKFIVVATGSFVGVFCALSLFAALHKPPMPPCPMAYHMHSPMRYHHHMHKFDRHDRGCFHHKKFEKKDFDKKAPVRVTVED